MRKCSLHFHNIADLCSFISDTQLRNFLLLGKKSILIAALTDGAVQLAHQTYRATAVETAEVFQIAVRYFDDSVC